MAYDELLADRIRRVLDEKGTPFVEKRMMGGLCIMVDGKMCMGVMKGDLMARVGPDVYEEALAKPGCRQMDFTGRVLKGYVYVDPSATDSEADLAQWVQRCLDFNPKAKASKKREKKV